MSTMTFQIVAANLMGVSKATAGRVIHKVSHVVASLAKLDLCDIPDHTCGKKQDNVRFSRDCVISWCLGGN